MINSQEEAQLCAKPYLTKEGVNVVYVNQHGLVWINNKAGQMEEYFATKKEKYFTVVNESPTPIAEVIDEPEVIDEFTTKKGRKKQS